MAPFRQRGPDLMYRDRRPREREDDPYNQSKNAEDDMDELERMIEIRREIYRSGMFAKVSISVYSV